jgi:hypothetical protein
VDGGVLFSGVVRGDLRQMAVCCQNLTLGALSSCSALSKLVGALFKKFGLFFEQASYFATRSELPPYTVKCDAALVMFWYLK